MTFSDAGRRALGRSLCLAALACAFLSPAQGTETEAPAPVAAPASEGNAGIAGSALADRQEYVNGVQLVYRLPDGRMMQSTQVGEM